MTRFKTSAAKDHIRREIDIPPIRAVHEAMKPRVGPIGYLGCPGHELLDIREWRPYLDFALASEKEPIILRDLKMNAGAFLPDGFLQATGNLIEDVLFDSSEDWDGTFEPVDQWPCIVNYDVYANPVLSSSKAFDPEEGFWRGMKKYLEVVRNELPVVLLFITVNLRGKTQFYDDAVDGILKEMAQYGLQIGPAVRKQFVEAGMDKKCQICIPYWLMEYGATSQGYGVEILDSIKYSGTQGKAMMHLILKFTRFPNYAKPTKMGLRRLVNFPHTVLRADPDGAFYQDRTEFPRV